MKNIFVLMALAMFALTVAADKWTAKADFGGGIRWGATGFAIGDKGYIGFGSTQTGSPASKKDLWEYDPVTNVWTQKADFPGTERLHTTIFTIQGKAYAGFGLNFGTTYKDFYEYDPVANAWTQKTDFPGSSRDQATSFVIGDKGYVGTGVKSSTLMKDFWQYDPTADTIGGTPWIQKADFGGGERSLCTGFSINGKGYIGLGSRYSADQETDLWQYEPTADTAGGTPWARMADFPGTERYSAAVFTIHDKAYIGVGADQENPYFYYQKDLYEYDPAADTWTKKTDFPGSGRGFSTCFTLGNKGYFGTGVSSLSVGSSSNQYSKDFYEYDPGTVTADSEMNETPTVNAYPNPCNGSFTLSGARSGDVLYMYDLSGRIVHTETVDYTTTIILSNGLYIWQVWHGRTVKGGGRLIINKGN